MGKVGNAAIEAREQARTRRIETETGRQQRDDRIDEATAAVILARAEIASARELAELSTAAARANFQAAVADIDEAAATTVAGQQQVIEAAVRVIVGEKLTVNQAAQLTELPPVQVRRICRAASHGDVTVGHPLAVPVVVAV